MDEARTTSAKLVRNVMSPSPVTIGADATVRDAARLLADGDVGSLPVVNGDGRLVGIVTDRDIVIRVVAGDLDVSAPVGEIASADICAVSPDASVEEAARLFGQAQVRRLPVVAEDDRLVGIITQADLARNADHKLTGLAVARISVPGAASLDLQDEAVADSMPASDPPAGPAALGGLRRA
jgi:CBS domain-containing protein